jgi:hypothetical protein
VGGVFEESVDGEWGFFWLRCELDGWMGGGKMGVWRAW